MKNFLSPLRATVGIAGPVLLTAALLRYLFKFWIPVSVGWGAGGNDFYFIFPGLVATFYFCFYSQARPFFRISAIPLASSMIVAFVGLNYFFLRSGILVTGSLRGVWFGFAVLVLLSVLRVSVSLRTVFSPSNGLLVGFCSLIGASIWLAGQLPTSIWQPYSTWFGSSLCKLFDWFELGQHCRLHPIQFDTRLGVGSIVVAIHRGCLGFDGFFLFLWAFLLFTLVRTKRPTLLLSTAAFLLGLIGIWWLNLFRVVLLVALVNWLPRWLGGMEPTRLMIAFFHTHAGWIFYTFYLAGFFALFGRVLGARKRSHEEGWASGIHFPIKA